MTKTGAESDPRARLLFAAASAGCCLLLQQHQIIEPHKALRPGVLKYHLNLRVGFCSRDRNLVASPVMRSSWQIELEIPLLAIGVEELHRHLIRAAAANQCPLR